MEHKCTQAAFGQDKCDLLNSAYILAGLAMMLNIRLSYSSAPYALIRFRLPENLFSVFVRRMASALELWCLPSMLLGNIMDLIQKATYEGTEDNKFKPSETSKQIKFYLIIVPSIVTQWLNFLTYVLLLVVYLMGGDQGRLTTFYFVIAISGFVFGINMTLLYSADYNYLPVYIAGENSFPIVTSFIHYLATLIFGNRRKYNSDYLIVYIDIWVAILISFVAAVVWTIAYGIYRDIATGPTYTITKKAATTNTVTIDSTETTITANKDYTLTETPARTEGTANIYFMDPTAKAKITDAKAGDYITAHELVNYGHILTETFDPRNFHADVATPCFMVIVGMGLVYAIYPGIAPGMIVPFYLIDKIEMVLLIATFFPPVIIAILRRYKGKLGKWTVLQPTCKWGSDEPQSFDEKKWTWTNSGADTDKEGSDRAEKAFDAWHWHVIGLILMVLKITLAGIFIYSLHYRESHISRSIINQPKMSTSLSITFYMCHEFLLALGFPGIIGANAGGEKFVLPAQYIGALFMIFLAFYSEGYIIEYKSNDPARCPTDGMWYLYGYYQLNPDFFIMVKFNVCSDGYCDFK